MKIFNIVVIFIYSFLFSIVGGMLIAFSLSSESFELAVRFIGYLVHSENLRLAMALTGGFLLLVTISIAQLSIGKLHRHRTIAFENPYGQVSVSLAAIEDYIKKFTHNMDEVKEIKLNMSAGKDGIEIISKAVLYSDVNIPETTEKIQNAIRMRLQEILGIEERFTIRLHVTKIVHREREKGLQGKDEVKKTEPDSFKGEIEYGG